MNIQSENIKISFVIPVYNAQAYIERCVESVLSQNLKEVEVIVVDDGSQDDTLYVCERLASKYDNVKCFHQANRGVTIARKNGLHHAIGEWIYFVDADDALPFNVMRSFLEQVDNSGCDIALGAWKTVYPHKTRIGIIPLRGKITGTEYIKSLLGGKVPIGGWGKIYKRQLLLDAKALDIPSNIINNEDLIMNLKVALCSKGVCVLPLHCIYYYYKVVPESVAHRPLPTTYWEMVYGYMERILPKQFSMDLWQYISMSMVLHTIVFGLDFRESSILQQLIVRKDMYTPMGKVRVNIAYRRVPSKRNYIVLKCHIRLRQINKALHYIYYKLTNHNMK